MGLTTKEISSSSFNDMISSVDRRSEYVENRAGANVRLNNFLTPYTLDDKSSILNAPCGYSNGVYPSLRPVGGENLLVQSNQFDTTWVLSVGIDLTSGQSGVYGSNNAWLLKRNSTGSRYVQQPLSLSSAQYSYSVYLKAESTNWAYLWSYDGAASVNAYFDLENGVVGQTGGAALDGTNIESVGNGWYRCTLIYTHAPDSIRIYPANSNGNISIGTDNGIYIQDAQLEKGAKANKYIETTTSPVKNADFSFTRGSAATRVTKDGLIKNVQILSDELVQNGDFEQIGSELITNGDFATDLSGWIADDINATNRITWESNGARFFCTNQNIGLLQQNVLTIGKAYKLTCDVNVTTGSIGLDGAILVGSTVSLVNGFNEIYFVADATTFKIKRTSTVSNCLLDNVSVKEVGQNWATTSSWSIANGKASYDGASNGALIQQYSILTNGKKYKASFNVLDNSGRFRMTVDGGTAAYQTYTTGNGYYTFEFTSTSTHFRIGGSMTDSADTFSIDNVSVIEITDDTDLPRIDYTDGTGSLLLEPQSTNLIPYSERFNEDPSNNRFNYRVTTVENSVISPSGDLNATSLIENSTTDTHVMRNTVSITQNLTYTFSVFAKLKSGDRYLRLNLGASNFNATFNLINKTVVDTTNAEGNIQEFENDWVRLSLTGTPTSSSYDDFDLRFINSNTDSDYYTGDGTSGFYVWGAQLEQLSYPSSYIPTSGSTVTRNADVCNNAGSSDLINSTEGVLYAEIAALTDTNTNRAISISDGTLNNRVVLRINSDDLYSYVQSNGTYSMFKSTIISEITNYNKIAVKYKENDFALWVNGSSIAVDTTGNSPIGLNILEFQEANGTSDFYGNVRSVAVFKEALTDEELAKITSTTQQEVFYEMKDRMLQIDADYYEFGDYTTRLKKLF